MRRRKFLRYAAFSRRHKETFTAETRLFFRSAVAGSIDTLCLEADTTALAETMTAINPVSFSPVRVTVANTDNFFGGDIIRRAFAAIPSGVTYSESEGVLTYSVTGVNKTLLSADDFTVINGTPHYVSFRFRRTDPDEDEIETGIVLKFRDSVPLLLSTHAADDGTTDLVADCYLEEDDVLTGIELCATDGSLSLLPDACRVGADFRGDLDTPHAPYSESVTVPKENIPFGIREGNLWVSDSLSLFDGVMTRRVGCVKLATLQFTLVDTTHNFPVYYATLPEPADPGCPLVLSKGYHPRADYDTLASASYGSLLSADGRGVFLTVLSTTKPSNLISAMMRRDTYYYYPLKTPKTEQLTPLSVGGGCGCSVTVLTDQGYSISAVCRV